MSDSCTLFDIERELDALLDEIEAQIEANGCASQGLLDLLQGLCEAKTEKIDRIDRFLTLMQNWMAFCRQQADHFQKRARTAASEIHRPTLRWCQFRGQPG